MLLSIFTIPIGDHPGTKYQSGLLHITQSAVSMAAEQRQTKIELWNMINWYIY